ncbi:response regulator [Dictyobacter arantiisoli]|uniref:Response regulatory domain-containing protein n=1 Tax=Dictyobacter arantiisoli TaxID=2014874 RepID=A0A5A5TDW1_9CHLR|nr:response regulator [Dictyobacter arantiisoli]GCF09074.1 hypothetical protein KDI_26380 [Dictyobacter arantiisoli]
MPQDATPLFKQILDEKNILIVEDDTDIGEFIVHAIEQETDYHATLAIDAFKALRSIQTTKPDMLLLDYQLPGMDGLELYHLLHTTEELEDTPVLFMSANFTEKELDILRLPYIEKPFELDDLLQTISRLIEK